MPRNIRVKWINKDPEKGTLRAEVVVDTPGDLKYNVSIVFVWVNGKLGRAGVSWPSYGPIPDLKLVYDFSKAIEEASYVAAEMNSIVKDFNEQEKISETKSQS